MVSCDTFFFQCIYPKSKPSGLKFFDLDSLDIDNPRNCLRLVREIECAFDKKYLTIIKKSGELRFFLLKNTLSSKQVTSASNRTFGSIHGLPLKFNNEKIPFHRLLAVHCYSSFNNAKSKQQEFSLSDEDLTNFDFYVNNLLDISLDEHKSQNVKQWLYNNPVGPDTSLAFDDLLEPDVIDQQFSSANDCLLNPTPIDDTEITQQQPPT
jgi:hypothetical protein